uniref:Si:rp71-45k5.2 n=1 Tax=Denticeps clupeoides TaxID=299321 RepID=A0AAY4C979_9TELE
MENISALAPMGGSKKRYVKNDCFKKLFFTLQIMTRLEEFVTGDRRGLENTIRVCLSTNDCFVKVPVNPEFPKAKKNFWTVDERRITKKMMQRHFTGTRDIFPALPFQISMDVRDKTSCKTPASSSCKATEMKSSEKFTSSFSIESILKKDVIPRMESEQLNGSVPLKRKGCWDRELCGLSQLPPYLNMATAAGTWCPPRYNYESDGNVLHTHSNESCRPYKKVRLSEEHISFPFINVPLLYFIWQTLLSKATYNGKTPAILVRFL